MGVDPISLGVEGEAASKAAPALAGGAKGAETAGGVGAGLAGAADVLAPATGVGAATGAGALTGLDALAAGLTPSGGSFVGLPDVASAATGAEAGAAGGALAAPTGPAPAAPTAAAVAPPPGVSSPLGVDPTAALGANAPSPLDTAAYPAGPIGAPGTAAATPVAGAAPSGSTGFLDTLQSSLAPSKLAAGIGESVAKNPLGLALAAGGLGYNVLQGQKQSDAVKALQSEAQQQGATGAQLEGYLTSGTLPPGLQQSVDLAVKNAKASAISNMASQGLSTDPKKNTALAAELAAIDQQVPILTAQIGEQLLQSGQAASGLASNLYTSLANIDQTQTAAIGKSIAAMAAALSGKQQIPGTNISVSTG